MEHALLARVGVDQLDRLGRPAGQLQVAQGLGVDREDRAGRAELRRHVADRRPVGQPQRRQAGAEELDELGDDAALAQHLGDGQHEVGGGRALGQFAAELEADHLRQQHRDRLAQHRRLGLDPADAPAEHAEAVDHRRVRVGADQRVGIGLQDAVALAAVDDLGDVLEVDLVADPGRRRHDAEVVEGLLPPLEERVALAVALELALGVDGEGARVAEGVDLDRVVDHEVDVDQRVDRLRVAADLRHRVAHRRQVDDGGHAGEVLHQHPRGLEGDLDAGLGRGVPGGDRLDVVGGHRDPVLEPQHVLQQHLDRVGQPGDVEALLQRVEAEDLVGAPADLEGRAGAKGVAAAHIFHPRQRSARRSRSRSQGQRHLPRRRRSGRVSRPAGNCELRLGQAPGALRGPSATTSASPSSRPDPAKSIVLRLKTETNPAGPPARAETVGSTLPASTTFAASLTLAATTRFPSPQQLGQRLPRHAEREIDP